MPLYHRPDPLPLLSGSGLTPLPGLHKLTGAPAAPKAVGVRSAGLRQDFPARFAGFLLLFAALLVALLVATLLWNGSSADWLLYALCLVYLAGAWMAGREGWRRIRSREPDAGALLRAKRQNETSARGTGRAGLSRHGSRTIFDRNYPWRTNLDRGEHGVN